MNETPDLLIAPSFLMQFAKRIEGVVCVNPGYLIKNGCGGTYSLINLEPMSFLSSDDTE